MDFHLQRRRLLNSEYIRDRLLELDDRFDRRLSAPSSSTPRFLGQVYDGGHMPSASEHFYLVHPVSVDGSETEGGSGTLTADPLRSVPVIVLGTPPEIGDYLTCHAISGRWIARNDVPTHYCLPKWTACGTRFEFNGTITDSLNGSQALILDFASGKWFSPWLPFTSSYILSTSPGANPCSITSGTSYYYYRVYPSGSNVAVDLFCAGENCHVGSTGAPLTFNFYNYSGGSYPGILSKPAAGLIVGQTATVSGTPSDCDPVTYSASWAGTIFSSHPPVTAASFSIPKWTPTSYGWSCFVPCPLPRKNLTLSWTTTGSPGSGTLVYDSSTKTWAMTCTSGITATITEYSGSALLTVKTYSGGGCTGTATTSTSGTYGSLDGNMWLSAYTCDPLSLTYSVFVGHAIYVAGYRTFVVTE